MHSNGTNITGQIVSSIFTSNYLSECSFPMIAILILLILITVKLCTRHKCDSWSNVASRTIWRDIHQTSISACPRTVSAVNLHRTVVSTPVTISSPTQSENTINAKETDSWWSKIGQHLINTLDQYQKQQESGGCGLENMGHSCYINSALQCLCHIGSFIEIILNLPEQQISQLPPITSAYRRLLTEMQSILEGSTNAYEVKNCISKLSRRFAGTDEQDSHEFLTVLVEALHDELVDNYQNSSIGELMHGIVRSTVKCLECQEETNTDDSFLSIPLPIHQSTCTGSGFDTIKNTLETIMTAFGYIIENEVSLSGCFENLLAMEQLGVNGQWFCHNCRKLTDATKKLELYQLPRVLILQLKRFTYDLTNDSKITTKIRIEEVLDLGQFVKKNGIDQPVKYNLMAVLTHRGTLASGHYTTFAQHLSNRCWYHFNDQYVRKASLSEVLRSDAYILIYERQHFRPSS